MARAKTQARSGGRNVMAHVRNSKEAKGRTTGNKESSGDRLCMTLLVVVITWYFSMNKRWAAIKVFSSKVNSV